MAKTLKLFEEPEEDAPEKPAEPKLIRPVKRLADSEPTVAGENDILLAFSELAWIAFKEDTASKLQNVELDIIRKKYLRHFQVDSHATAAEGEAAPQTLAARRCELEAAVCAYAREHKAELITKDSKTKDFGVGTVAFKQNPESLMPLPADKPSAGETTPSDADLLKLALDKLLDEYDLPKVIERALKKKAGETGRKLSDFLRFTWAWDARGIVTLIKDKLVTNAEIEPLGLKVDRTAERVEIKLKA